MDEIKSWFEVPAIAHFFHVFKSSFGLIEFEIEDFEEALFLDSAENVSSFLPDLVIQLLRGLYKTKDGLQVTMENYNSYMQDLFEYRYVAIANKKNPVAEETFKALSTRQKVETLYDMCNWRLEMGDAMELTKNLEAEEMRVMPVGSDSEGYQFWYFYGTRLYREKCFPSDYTEETDTTSENEQVTKAKSKAKKKRGKKRKIRTKSGRAVKQRLEYDPQTGNAISEDDNNEDDSDSEKIETKIELDEKPVLKPHTDSEWSIVCSTVDEWLNLLEYYKNTKDKNERCLLKGLEELNEVMPDIFAEKEKALQRKLLAMAPKRSSDRILIKVQIREDEERKKEQRRILKSQLKAQEVEKRLKDLKIEKEKEREKRYLERERNLEMRALRAKQREESKLVAENPELAREFELANKDQKNYSLKLDLEGEEDEKYFNMDRVMEVLKDDDDAWPFLDPVNAEEAPNYYDLIKEPMDLSTIESKVKGKKYKDKSEFEDDVILMFDNCETYNGTYSSYTKLANTLKKVFEKQMRKEFPPEKINQDELYEDMEIKKTPKMKLVKELTPKVAREKKPREPNILQALKKNNLILTPEFAHAQILQAQAQLLHKTQTPQGAAGIPQILPKLGISQDILAKLTPAQMQSLIMQLRSGTLSTQNITGASPKIAPKYLASSPRPTVASSPRLQGSSHLNITPNSIVNVNKQTPRLAPKTSVTQYLKSPSNLKIATPPGAIIRPRLNSTNGLPYLSTPQGQPMNISFVGSKATLNPTGAPKLSSVLFQKSPATTQLIGNSLSSSPITLHNIATSVNKTNAARLAPSMQLQQQSQQQQQTSPFSGPLLIQGKKTNVLPQLKQLETPVLGQSNVRYIGQPNGQLQKIVYLQTPQNGGAVAAVAQANLLNSKPTALQTGGMIRGITASNFQNSRTAAQTPRQVVPIYLTPQGVPLQVVRPGSSAGLTSTSVKILSGNQMGLNKVALPGHVMVKTSSLAPAPPVVNRQNLQGLKKAVQQVAAVTQINAKLQNHMQNKNNQQIQPQTVGNATIKNKVTIKPLLSNDKKVLNSPIALKVPVASLQSPFILSNSSTVPKVIATTAHAGGTSVMLSPVRSVGKIGQQQQQQQLIKGILPGSKQTNVSFILTSSGLVSVGLPSSATPQLAMLNGTNLGSTQNIITSCIPSVFTAQTKPTLASSMMASMPVRHDIITPVTSLPSTAHIPPVTKSVITPEKLRDAEALLGLINPTHLKPVSSSPVTVTVPNVHQINSQVNAMMNSTTIRTGTPFTNGSPVKIAPVPGSQFKTNSIQRSIITSPLATTNNVKIQLPNTNSPFKSQTDFLSTQQQQQTAQLPPPPHTATNTVKTNNGAVTTPAPKMIVDAAQLLKLREEGKIMVTPSGQMFLLTNSLSPPK